MLDPTPKYGITRRTRKPIAIAASRLSQAITALERHQEDEQAAFAEAVGRLAVAVESLPADSPERANHAQHMARLEGIAPELRSDRGGLVDLLAPLRAPLADLLVEAQSLLPGNAALHADVEPDVTEPAPKPLLGVDLTVVERLRIVLETLAWTQRIGQSVAISAEGPRYALSVLIEHPTDEAKAVGTALVDAGPTLTRFIVRR